MKLLAVHLLTEPESERETRSIANIRSVCGIGKIKYLPIVNALFTESFPEPRQCNDRPMELTKAHYGCYLAHKNAILEYLTPKIDALLIFECDALPVEPLYQFYKRIRRAYRACVEGNLDVFTFGPKHNGKTIDRVGKDVIVISQFIETHAYMVPVKSRGLIEELFSLPWDAADFIYTVYGYDQRKIRIGTFADRPVAVQGFGMSLIDRQVKTSEQHFRYVRYE